MNIKAISQEINQLPPEGQREVLDFVIFLKSQFKSGKTTLKKGSVVDAPFIGMWKDREDMSDSVAWVRKIRKEQWSRHV